MNSFESAAAPNADSPRSPTQVPVTPQNKQGFWITALRRMPRWLLFLFIAALYTLVMLGMDFLTGESIEPLDIAVTAASGLAVSAVAFWMIRWQRARERRKPVGWPTVTNFRAAVSSGQLPKGAEAEQWVPELTKALRLERPMTWIGMTLFIGFAGLGVFLISDNPDHPWFWVIATVLFAALAAWYPLWAPRRRRKLRDLLAQFPGQDA